jgi:hypothetical protein
MLKIYDTKKACWTVRDHLMRENSDGISGWKVLMDYGVEYVDETYGDLEIAIDGMTDNPQNAILYILEPPLVSTSAYVNETKRNFLANFLCIDKDPNYVKQICGHEVNNVYSAVYCSFLNYKTNWENKEKHMVCVAAMQEFHNQFTEKYSLYKYRNGILDEAAKRYGDKFDFYGRSGSGGALNYRGRIDGSRYEFSKMDVVYNYNFIITLENSNFNGYVTKIDQPLVVRSIPIYFGSESVKEFVPKDLYIDISDFGSIEGTLDYVDSLSEDKIKKWIQNIDDFIKDPKKTYRLSSIALADEFIECLKNLNLI